MLRPEAEWFGRQLARYPDHALFPMCNVGSANASMQQREQPWIDEHILGPLRRRGGRPLNVDLFPGEGVDLAGDLLQDGFVAELAARGFRSAFCSNVLEHVADAPRLAASLVRVLPPGGLLFLSVPHRFPYHPDPIDTLYRPTPEELAALFPGTTLEAREIVSGGTLVHYIVDRVRQQPLALLQTLAGKVLGRGPAAAPATSGPSHGGLALLRTHLPWLARRFEVSCAVVRKI